MRSTWLGGLRLLSCGDCGDSVRFPVRREAPSRAPDGEKPAWNQWRAAGRGRLAATPDGLGVRARAEAVRLSRSNRIGVRGCGAALPSGPGAVTLGSRRRCGWYCAPKLSRLNTCPLFSHWIVWRQAPGAAGGSRRACGAQRRRGQSCSGPSRSTVQAKRMALPASLFSERTWLGENADGAQIPRRNETSSGREEKEARGWVAVSRAKGGRQTLPPAQAAVGRGTVSLSPFPVLEGDRERRTIVPESAQCLE